MKSHGTIRNDLGKVLTGNLGGQVVGIVRGIVIPLFVTPTQYGLWRIVLLAWQYGMYIHLGTFALLNRELPGLLKTGDLSRFSKMRQTAFWGTMVLAALAALGIILYSFSAAAGADSERLWALRISALGLVAQLVMMYSQLDHRVHSRFGKLSVLIFAHGLVSLLVMIPLAIVAGVPGLAFGLLVATIFVVVTFGRRDAFDSPRLDSKDFIRQVKQGVPLSSLPFLNSTIGSVGQIVTASVLGLEPAGYYGLGAMIGAVIYSVPRSLGKVLYPRYLESYAATQDPKTAGPLVWRSVQIVAATTALTASCTAIILDPVFTYVFPKYLPALGATYALVTMMPFLSIALVLQNALLALRLHAKVISLQLFFVAISAALAFTAATMSRNVTWVAVGIMVASVGYGLSTMWLTFSSTGLNEKSGLREVVTTLLPVVAIGGIAIATINMWNPSDGPASAVWTSFGQLLIVSPVAVFFCWRATRDVSGA